MNGCHDNSYSGIWLLYYGEINSIGTLYLYCSLLCQ